MLPSLLPLILPLLSTLSSVKAVDLADAPPPDGEVPFGLNAELGSLIREIVEEPIQVLRTKKVIETGNGFTYDFINTPNNQFNGKGGFFSLADDSDFPANIGNGMATVLLVIAPCGMLQPHYQPRANEYGYLISGGPMRWALMYETGGPVDYEFMQVGQGLSFPKGSMHYGAVLGCDPTLVLAGFDNEDPGFNLVHFAFWGFDDEAIGASEGTYGVQPVDAAAIPIPLNLGVQQCLDRCGIDRSVYDVGQVSKLQMMQASFTAYAKRVLAGNLSTFTPLSDLDFTQTTRANIAPFNQFGIPEVAKAASGPGSISGASTIGNLSGIDYTKNGASTSGSKIAAVQNGNGPSIVSDPMGGYVNHVDPSSWMAGMVNIPAVGQLSSSTSGKISGFAATNGESGGESPQLKSYRIATYVLSVSSVFFITATGFLFFAVSKQKRGDRLGGRPLMAQAYDS